MKTLLILASALFCAQIALGQNTARIRGRVIDVAGAAIPRTEITISDATSSFSIVSDENGNYQIDLPAGIYQVSTGKMPGFSGTRHADVRVRTGETTELSITPAVSLEGAICVLEVTGTPLVKPKKQRQIKKQVTPRKRAPRRLKIKPPRTISIKPAARC